MDDKWTNESQTNRVSFDRDDDPWPSEEFFSDAGSIPYDDEKPRSSLANIGSGGGDSAKIELKIQSKIQSKVRYLSVKS